MKKKIAGLFVLLGILALVGCSDAADVASRNVSKAAENFEVQRRVVFYDSINAIYMLSIEGRCAIYPTMDASRLDVVCKYGPDQYKKHFLGLSDNVTYFAEQLEFANVSEYHYRVTFKPQLVVPDVDFQAGDPNFSDN